MLKTIKDRIDKKFIIRFIKFGVVGTSGIAVNTGVLWVLKGLLGVPLAVAPIFAIGTAVLSNFILNNYWTWNENKKSRKHSFFHRLWRYYLSASLGALINYVVLLTLTNYLDIHYLIANLAGIFLGMVSNFMLGEFWVFKSEEE
ncbi:MAG: GtrA family protein [Melioribacteraceae bacterium]|nr:GtrA family protein [Melioribacteraceae bacterium]